MKRILFAIVTAITLSSCGVGYYSSNFIDPIVTTPIPVSGSINISIQPSWGPAGYNYAMYYYFPDFNFYYDVERALFHYLNYGRWVSAKMLPRGRHFPTDLHRYYKVVINNHNPWNYNRQHKNQYKRYKGIYNQRTLRDVRNNQDAPRRIHNQYSTPSRNNNSMYSPQSAPNRGQGSRSNVGQGQRNNQGQGNISRPSGNNTQRNNSSQGNIRQNNNNSSNNRSSGAQSSNSSGSRSTGSRGR